MTSDALSFQTIDLPDPGEQTGLSVWAALHERRTIRDIDTQPLPLSVLSDLLWAACGVNRAAGPFGAAGLTAGSASNSQEIDVYLATASGLFLYQPHGHRLGPVCAGDWRKLAMTPHQPVPATAPVQLIYVANLHRLTHTAGFDEPGLHDAEVQKSYYFVDTGLIAGNVYLFAAARGLAAWFHNCDKAALAERLQLGADRRVLFAQSVGYPALQAPGG
jgi:nitroreductase